MSLLDHRRSPRSPFAALVALATLLEVQAASRSAVADDDSCVAASEREIPLRKAGKLREALDQLGQCASASCPAEVKNECARRILAINAVLPTLVLAAADPAGNDLVAVRVTLDGVPIASSLDGRAVPVNPGSHLLRFEASGSAPVERTVVVGEGEKERRIRVTFGAAGPSGGSSWSTQRTVAVLAAGVGVLGLGVGAVTGILAAGDASTAKSDCQASSCTQAGHNSAVSEHTTSASLGDASTASFVVGGVGAAAAIVLWFTAPRTEHAAGSSRVPLRIDPVISAQGGSLTLRGGF